MHQYKVYIFDLDDTLVATHAHVTEIIYPKLAEKLGVEYLGAKIALKFWGEALDICLPKFLKGEFDFNRALSLLNELHDQFPVRPFPYVTKAIDTLKKHGKFTCILTAGNPNLVTTEIELGLKKKKEDFDYVYITANEQYNKPSGQIIGEILQRINKGQSIELNPQDVLYIGDSISDFEVAKNANIDFYGLTTGIYTKSDFLNAGLAENKICDSFIDIFNPLLDHGIVSIIKNGNGDVLMVQEGRKANKFYLAWSGPHGRCKPTDIVEEETVIRETFEEVGIQVEPVKKLAVQAADSKIKTVSFWLARPTEALDSIKINSPHEVMDVKWISIKEIQSGEFELYPGTKYFFEQYAQ